MATAASNSVNFSLVSDDRERDDAKVGLALVGIVLLFLFALVVLKLCCNLMIDVIILRDGECLLRTISQIKRFVCPWWHPRTEPTRRQSAEEGSSRDRQQRIAVNSADSLPIDMENLLVGMTPKQKQHLLASILTSKSATESDIFAWKTCTSQAAVSIKEESPFQIKKGDNDLPTEPAANNDNTNPNNLLCPICIHDISVGEIVCYSGLCHHVFHRDCLSAWLSTHSRICPYCRREILTQEMLNEAHRLKLNWLENASDDSDGDKDELSLSSDDESVDSLGC
jgi:hypothetical protein